MSKIDESICRQWAYDILLAMGAKPEHARVVSDHLVDANLAGHDSHGLVRLPQYQSQVRSGEIDTSAEPEWSRFRDRFAVFDAKNCWGPVTAMRMVEFVAEQSLEHGFAGASVRHCPHIGRVGIYASKLAEQGLFAQAWCNCGGAARVAPWGGVQPRLATNPMAFAMPTSSDPVVVDITTSVVAEGKVRIEKNAGRRVPTGWILDGNGSETTNPEDLYQGGSILPLGGSQFGHKGFALGMLCDMIAGVWAGSGCGLMTEGVFSNGLMLLAIRIEEFADLDRFKSDIDEYIRYLKATPRRDGVDEILIPGEPELRMARERRQTGIPIDAGTFGQLVQLSESLGVPRPSFLD